LLRNASAELAQIRLTARSPAERKSRIYIDFFRKCGYDPRVVNVETRYPKAPQKVFIPDLPKAAPRRSSTRASDAGRFAIVGC
jgi:hypothetical protein